MRWLAVSLIVAAVVWPALLAASAWSRLDGRHPLWSGIVYAAASRVCHQRPERSFYTAGVKWPVCGRCSGLYLAAPLGALAAAVAMRRRARADRHVLWLAVAALPTAVTLAVEWLGLAPVSNLARFVAALPLGATIAFVLVRTADGAPESIR
ncbi:MAG TPA: DUF2085 domain-containing protein [Vicinamibacterales bacterium]|nr:DUF2085 domain-containing protein [Vicinamibacterales bacterium]